MPVGVSVPPPCRRDLVAVRRELQALERDRVCHGDGAGRAGEHRHAATPGGIDIAGRVGPVGEAVVPGAGAPVDRPVAGGEGAIPELHGGCRRGDHQIDLTGHVGLDRARIGCRQCPDSEGLVGERAAVVEDPIHARGEPPGVGDVEGAGQREIAGDVGQVAGLAARCCDRAKLVIQDGARRTIGARCEGQTAHRERARAVAGRQDAAVRDCHAARDRARAAERRPAPHSDGRVAERTVPLSPTCSVPAATVVAPV